MIIRDYSDTIMDLKEMETLKSLGMGGALILDLDESLVPDDVVYAYKRCLKCGDEYFLTLGEEPPKKCLCGHPELRGYTADIVVQGKVVLFNYNRDHIPVSWPGDDL